MTPRPHARSVATTRIARPSIPEKRRPTPVRRDPVDWQTALEPACRTCAFSKLNVHSFQGVECMLERLMDCSPYGAKRWYQAVTP